ncbi:hypothetical protein ID853_15150 [Xenorhabdus sp. Vera]|uniref:hypothetical protein n=1 Tax=Xenorhabdus koppenhoeferi TaxID=351659 RepID=UPI0019C16D7A|nr:hypothetical protein [Xenorhabdus sp. Vera]MBD2812188.1 hypothetical protein [Xenorhabdus sp. Vera]
MMILDWPETVIPNTLNWQLISNSKTFTSVFNGSSQTVRFPGSRWRCVLTFNILTDEKARLLESLIARLDGESGRVRLFDWARPGLMGMGSPYPKVSEANQLGRSLNTDGWQPNRRVLRQGDYLTVGNELKMATGDVVSNNAGMAIIPISPMLRYSPGLHDKIETEQPFGIFRQTGNDQGNFQRKPGIFTSTSLSFEEALF